jgi:hypothetical protein
MQSLQRKRLGWSATTAIATMAWIGLGSVVQALPVEGLTGIEAVRSQSGLGGEQIAQMLYPPVSSRDPGLMVVGQGIARRAADSARIELQFYRTDPYYDYYGWEEGDEYVPPPAAPPLSEADFRPVVNAIIATGVPANAIDVDLTGGSAGYFGSTNVAAVIVTLRNPTQTQVRNLVTAANEAVTGSDIYSQGTYVNYQIDNCAPLLRDVYMSAIEDAQSRAQAMAAALEVQINPVPSVAESPFNLFYPPCGRDQPNASSMWGGYNPAVGTFYDPNMPAEVQVQRDIFVTFPIRN